MKKTILMIGILLLTGLGAVLSKNENEQVHANKKAEQINATPQSELFTKEKALKKMQDYKIQIDLKSPTIVKGTTLLGVYEARGKIPAVKNLGWDTANTDSGKFIVSFRQEIGSNISEPKWE